MSIELVSLIVASLALVVAIVAVAPARRSATASERSASAAERSEIAAVAAADRAARVQQEQATREAYRATLVEFRNAAEELRSGVYGAALVMRLDQEGDLARNAQVELDRLADAVFAVHSRFGPELEGEVAGAMGEVLRAVKATILSTIPVTRAEGWEQRRLASLNVAYEQYLSALAVFREAHQAYLTKDLSQPL